MGGFTSKKSQTPCQEYETSLQLWIAANDAKAERIKLLEAECKKLRLRLARASRLTGRAKKKPINIKKLRQAT